MKVSQRIRLRIAGARKGNKKIGFHANHNIAPYIKEGELEEMIDEVAAACEVMLNALVIDTANDHNTKGTARRMAKMFVNEWFSGRYTPAPDITDFPNALKLDQVYTVGPITMRSTCSHHFVPIEGEVWIGIMPSPTKVIGLSKFNRLVEWVCGRPQIQEEMVQQIADHLQQIMDPRGIAVAVRAKHHCMSSRGVKDNGTLMVNSVVRGIFLTDSTVKQEFFNLIRSQGF